MKEQMKAMKELGSGTENARRGESEFMIVL